MTIQIKRNNAGNCITFVGSSKPVYFNSCLSGRVNPDDNTRIDIINDINTTDVNNPVFEFFAVDYNLFRDADNNAFATAQDAADYITSQGNTIGNTGTFELQDHNSLAFTKTTDGLTILVDNGDAHALETLSARIDEKDNTKLEITNHTASRSLYSNISPDNVLYNNNLLLTGSLNDMVNQLNAYFNGQPLQSAVSEGVTTQLSGGEFATIWYIENTPGIFTYPLFKNSDDADLVAEDLGNSGHTSIVFPSDPTNTTWYLPTGGSSSVTTDPTFLIYAIDGVSPNWNEQTAQYPAPAAFADTTVTVDELSAVNIQVHPQGGNWATTITNLDGSNFVLVSDHVYGLAPEVLQDNIVNPSDDYRVTITRTNSYGSSTGTLTVRVNNLTAPTVQAITGFTWEPTSTALTVDDELNDGSVVTIDDTVPTGRRFIISQAWVEANVLPNLNEANDFVVIGIKDGSPSWGSLDVGDFDVHIKWEWLSSTSHTSTLGQGGVNQSNSTVASLTDAYYDYAFEVDGTDVHAIACNFNDINTQHSVNDGGTFSRTITRSNMPTGPHTIYLGVKNTTMDLTLTGLSEIDIPATPLTNLTDWNKAVDFSGGNEHLKQNSTTSTVNALRMQGLAVTADNHSSDTFKTSDHVYSRPWASTIVFQSDDNNSNQHIWNSGEGTATGKDNMYLRLNQFGGLYFGWGREGSGYNEYLIASNLGTSWYGVYIGHKGGRFNASNATSTNLNNAFVIQLMFYNGTDWVFNPNPTFGGAGQWTSTGARMDRTIAGDFTIGGRGSNRNFHGKVASMVITTLRRNQNMPDATEMELMITDPKKWENDYRVGQTVRLANNATESTYNPSSSNSGYYGTQIWLMGDGTNDSFSNGIRNQVLPSDGTYTKLTFNSMLSNDIENVSINGLS
jgi:plastocyanin